MPKLKMKFYGGEEIIMKNNGNSSHLYISLRQWNRYECAYYFYMSGDNVICNGNYPANPLYVAKTTDEKMPTCPLSLRINSDTRCLSVKTATTTRLHP
jgi:hypothetical protein